MTRNVRQQRRGSALGSRRVSEDLPRPGQNPALKNRKAEDLVGLPGVLDSATPFRKPTKMGLDKKSASAPRRRKLAAIHINPVSKASNAVGRRQSLRHLLRGERRRLTITAQVAASGPTMSWRDEPKIA